jgi:N5-(cytidine 5'-diphosphoramidyl)-L-glutamine hydrolase
MTPKRIAISQRTVDSTTYYEPRDALAHDWYQWVKSMLPDAVLFAAPNAPEQANNWWRNCQPDMLILSGGNDWGESPVRDRTEGILFEMAREANIPILGVCRGLHVVNRLLGGGEPQNLDPTVRSKHVASCHSLTIPGSISDLFGLADVPVVNSYHNQGIDLDAVSNQVKVFATSAEGIVEGLYHQSEQIIAVQWHPERDKKASDLDRFLLDALIGFQGFWNREKREN